MGQTCPMTCALEKFRKMIVSNFSGGPRVMGQTCPMTCGLRKILKNDLFKIISHGPSTKMINVERDKKISVAPVQG